MEDLFRLALVRPAVAQDPGNPSIDLDQDTDFQNALRAGVDNGEGRPGLVAASEAYIADELFLGTPAVHPQHDRLAALGTRLADLSRPDDGPGHGPHGFPPHRPGSPHDPDHHTRHRVVRAITEVFDAQPEDVVADEEFTRARSRLRDSLLAIKLLQPQHARPLEALTGQLRTMELIARVAADEDFPDDAEQLRRARHRSLRIPIEFDLRSRLSTRDAEAEARKSRQLAEQERRQRVADLLNRHELLRSAVAELGTVHAEHFRVSAQAQSEAVAPPEELDLVNAVSGFGRYAQSVRELNIKQLERTTDTEPPPSPEIAATQTMEFDGEPVTDLATALVRTGPAVLSGRPGFTATDPVDIGFVLKPSGAQSLSERTRGMLAERKLEPSALPLDRITGQLERELATTVEELERVAGHPVKRSVRFVGDAVVTVATPITKGWGEFGTGGVIALPDFPLEGSVPQTKGEVAPAGVADLLLVRQQLTGYEGADVAHIENVLEGERKLREHTRREETELIEVEETEVSTSEEHELETADRFEMTRESNQTLKEDLSFKAGLQVSGKYGPTVEFTASAEGAYSRTKEEATRTAATFSQDVTERTARKIAERTLTRSTSRITTDTVEKNSHELNNESPGHISGVYQWVSKVYQARMFNYGLRAMFDFMVPEPAAFLIATMRQAHTAETTIEKPPPFTLTPAQLSESNYAYWVRQTGATGVTPPPELYRTKSATFKAGGGEEKQNYNHAGQLTVDEGYRAVYGSVGALKNIWKTDATTDVVLGRRTHRFGLGDWLWTTTLDDERDTVPYAVDTFHCSQIAVAVEVKTQRTDRAMEQWRLDTHAKLAEAHRRQVADYEEKLAQLELQAGVSIRGRNPRANEQLIQAELRKNCVSILTDQHFDLFDAIHEAPGTGLPQLDIDEADAEGDYVRFFEHAFEWEHMSWVSYPYYWGRKSNWDEVAGYADPDPKFEEFLKAGYARVTVPARPGFEGAIDHFLTFGELWNGGPLPPISSPLYLPIADEIAEQLDRPGTEVPQGDPWTVRVPTSLVKLRADDDLPRWEQNDDGDWVEE
ncbi:hypothetical protein IU501_17090 [Nocardia otitidiscaviarum]|uniref:hypothetical protein n=1 Tax=Nocardia otitidiscaviarum TaxID=1823 RepID=UPI001894F0B8|nr:hypothetical protein [Nocardia otitidiscaviarum]MBF6134713.1 hypothetical protein [Nocardia otitidiscaviarum]